MQDNPKFDPTINIAFQALLQYRQITCLLVDQEHHLLKIYGDALGILKDEKDMLSKDVLKLLPAPLQIPTSIVLKRAQDDGTAKLAGCSCAMAIPDSQIGSQIGSQSDTVTIAASRHNIHETTEVLTVLIERDQQEYWEGAENSQTTELMEMNSRLRAQVLEQQQTEQELAYQAQALARSNADLEEFAYVVSHDLQEPLRAMTAFSQLLEQRYGQQLDSSAQRYITHIVDGGTRMKAMIDGILELSRINHKQPTHAPTDLNQALEIALENLELMRRETQATITHGDLPTLFIDKNHIIQLLQNLIGNGIKFRGPEPPHIHITAEPQANKWLFAVHDNGIGIPHDQQKRIFKLFQRLHNQQEQKGYGIGLAICKRIVEHHQGDIWLESSPGEGAIFYFTLTVNDCQKEV
ncbi:sensor histidine kinase [Leptothoe sp. PORK10 BA2]|uniref:sensor histidine kinase n=1 Tax=Leptothoe sp. PORK10 BA2 TaxID=3110254 RepID=UPI002B201FE2|nr:ATP-binding protein [Leptothoe sp. PORK10 BA2]